MPTLTFSGGPFDGDTVTVNDETIERLMVSVRGMKTTGFIVIDPYVFFADGKKGRAKVQVCGVTNAKRNAVYRWQRRPDGMMPWTLKFVGWE